MIHFENTIEIARDPGAVFSYLAELENLPAWNYAIQETCKLDPGPVGVGSRYVQIRTVPARSEETFEVTEFEPGRRLAIRGRFGPLAGELSYVLEPSGAATALINTVALDAPRLLAPLAARQIRTAVAGNLQVLRQNLERGRHPSHPSHP
jgi:uncharacterized protein YndB with AHSA1/START domain